MGLRSGSFLSERTDNLGCDMSPLVVLTRVPFDTRRISVSYLLKSLRRGGEGRG